jgi:DNA mismatch endonuclease (patch repair protein)
MDIVSPERRSAIMSRIRGKHTKPEVAVRRLLHASGFRFRLHRRDLPGTPDIAFPSRHKAVFVHGCFWHAHERCPRAFTPKTRRDFWSGKLARNRARDAEHLNALRGRGWDVHVVWECEIGDAALASRLGRFLRGTPTRRAPYRGSPAGRALRHHA